MHVPSTGSVVAMIMDYLAQAMLYGEIPMLAVGLRRDLDAPKPVA
jgi:hypothetical protein